jgi:hypothetical protein
VNRRVIVTQDLTGLSGLSGITGSSEGPAPPNNGYVAEDNTTNYVAEDGTTYYVWE